MSDSKPLHILRHDNAVFDATFSPDGRTIATGCLTHDIELWDVATGRSKNVLRGHSDGVCSLHFRSGSELISASFDKTVRFWDPAKNTALYSVSGHQVYITDMDVSQDGNWLATSSHDKTVMLWDAQQRILVATFKDQTDLVLAVAFSPDSLWLASAGHDRTVRVWNVKNRGAHRVVGTLNSKVHDICFSPDSSRLFGSDDQGITVWDVESGRDIQTLKTRSDSQTSHAAYVQCLDCSRDGRWLVSGGRDATIRLWSLKTLQLAHVLRGHENTIYGLQFSRDSKRLVSASFDRTSRIWDIESDSTG